MTATTQTELADDDWAIVGGGLIGMTLALRLAQAGKRVTLFEAAGHLGGLADAWQVGDVTWDRHYHVTLLSDNYLRSILVELELDDAMQWVETKTGFYTDGKLYSVSNAWEFLKFPPLNLIDKFRLGWTIFYGSKVRDWRRLEQIPVTEWLARLSGRRTCEKIWLPLLRAKLGDNYRWTSAAFIWATIARLYAARRTGLKREMFGYLPGSYHRIVAAFQQRLEQLGVDVRLNSPIASVEQGQDDIPPDSRAPLTLRFQNGTSAEASQAVLTLPSQMIPRICPQLTPAERAQHQSIKYQGIVCASLLLKRPLSGFYVTNITDDGIPFTGVIEMTALVDRACFAGRTLVYLPKYVPTGDPIFHQSDEEIQRLFLAGLQRMYPDVDMPENVEAFRVSRVPHVMALSTVNYSRNLPTMRTSVDHLFVINSAQIVNGTLNVNETVKLAESAVREVLLPACRRCQQNIENPTS